MSWQPIYFGMALFTAAYLYRLNRPTSAGAWLALVGFSIGWPILFLWVLYGSIRRG